MGNVEKRFDSLDKIFGIMEEPKIIDVVPEPSMELSVIDENKSMEQLTDDDKLREYREIQRQLEIANAIVLPVLQEASNNAMDSSKASDYLAVSDLTKNITDIQMKKFMIAEKIYQREKKLGIDSNNPNGTNLTQNNIYVNSFKDLNNILRGK